MFLDYFQKFTYKIHKFEKFHKPKKNHENIKERMNNKFFNTGDTEKAQRYIEEKWEKVIG